MLLVLGFQCIPYISDDHSRVILHGDSECPEYVNASFIEVNPFDTE